MLESLEGEHSTGLGDCDIPPETHVFEHLFLSNWYCLETLEGGALPE